MNDYRLGGSPSEHDITSARLYLEYYGGRVNELIKEVGRVRGYVASSKVFDAVVKFLSSEGWALSGSGYFSAVFVKGGLALKVGFKREDSGATYAAWSRANQGKAGVPVIHAIDKFSKCYVVLMDRCYPVATLGGLDPYRRTEIESIRGCIEFGDDSVEGFPSTASAREIHEFFKGIAHFDLNEGNVMLDRYGNPIITDPVSYDHGRAYYTTDRPDDDDSTIKMEGDAIPAFLMPAS